MKVYLTNQLDLKWICEVCDSAHAVTYSWPKPIIIDEGEFQKMADHHHAEWSPNCCGTPKFEVSKGKNPLQEFHMSPLQRATIIVWLLFPFLAAAAIGLVFFLARLKLQ